MLLTFWLACTATAQDAAGTLRKFHIQPQPMASALLAYAQQADLELIAVGSLSGIHGRYGVSGRMSNEDALRTLLAGSGLDHEWRGKNMVIVMRKPPSPKATRQPSASAARRAPKTDAVPLQSMDGITVTARLHAEKMLDVPIAMSAMTGEQMSALGMRDVSEVARMTPGVGSINYGGGFTALQIRGVSASLGSNANGYYLDGVPFTGITVPWYPDARAWDIDRVEVLKGPQGTTFGEGSMGGTVRIITRKPEFNQLEAAIDLNGSGVQGGGNGWGVKTMLNLPVLQDKLALRVDATDEILPGWIRDSTTGAARINKNRIRTGRLKLRYAPIKPLTVDVSYWSYWLRTDDGYNLALDDGSTPNHYNAYDPWSVRSLVATYDLPSSQWFYAAAGADLRRNSSGMLTPHASYDSRIGIGVRTRELRWSSTGERTLSWTLGYYRRKATRNDTTRVDGTRPIGASQSNNGHALYGETIVTLPDPRWTLTSGLRYFSDRVDARSSTAGRQVLLDARFDSWNPRLALAFKPVENRLFYASIARGFRSGQLQPVTSFTLAEASGIELPVAIHPDSIISYEIGTKNQSADGHWTLEAALFHSRWKNVAVRVPITEVFNGAVNSKGTRSTGLEMSFAYVPNPSMSFQFGGSYTHAVYVASVPDTPLQKGSPVYNVPNTTLDGTFAYRHPLASGLQFTARGKLVYNSPRRTGLTRGEPGDAITMLSARFGIEAGTGWSLYLFGDNLTNDHGALSARDEAGLAYRLQPRTIGIEASWYY